LQEVIYIFERPCPDGWVYPCSREDIADHLAQFPLQDVEGLWAVGLVPSTRKNDTANARYFFGTRPTIHIYSHRCSLQFKQPPQTKQIDIGLGLYRELQYGLKVELQGRRYISQWAASDLRRFIREHVLAHEIGHHVHCRQRQQQGYTHVLSKAYSEQFAEAYAVRMVHSIL
jgi:uncharacterized protein YjaZ